jgi:CBS domain containing-hemolysin-like protein
MPDPDGPSRSDPSDSASEPEQLSEPPQRDSEAEEERSEGWLVRALRALLGWKTGSLREDLEVVLETEPSNDTGFSPQERTLLKNILELRELRVEDVMIPRSDIVAVQQQVSLGEQIKLFERAGHSRLVVYGDSLDDPVGMVHIRDVVAYFAAHATLSPEPKSDRNGSPPKLDLSTVDFSTSLLASNIIREILFVPPSMFAVDLLARMQATRIHLALVIDEYGGTDGLVSMEDIVEEIVGEIDDEHDESATPTVVRQPDGSFLADARANLEDVTTIVGAGFDVGDVADEVDTLGGYLVTRLGRVPVRGEVVSGPGDFEIEVLDADPRRVKKAKIYRAKKRPPGRGREAKRTAGRHESEDRSGPASPEQAQATAPVESKAVSPDRVSS